MSRSKQLKRWWNKFKFEHFNNITYIEYTDEYKYKLKKEQEEIDSNNRILYVLFSMTLMTVFIMIGAVIGANYILKHSVF